MMTNKQKVFDGDYEIIFSDSFNIYENHLTITEIAGFTFEFEFEKKIFQPGAGSVQVNPNNETKTVNVRLQNFRNNLGVASSNKLHVIDLDNSQKIYLTIYGKSLSDDADVLNVTVTFYQK